MSQYSELSESQQIEMLRSRIQQVEGVLFMICVELDEYKAIEPITSDSAIQDLNKAVEDKSRERKYNEARLCMLRAKLQQLVNPPVASEALVKPSVDG